MYNYDDYVNMSVLMYFLFRYKELHIIENVNAMKRQMSTLIHYNCMQN